MTREAECEPASSATRPWILPMMAVTSLERFSAVMSCRRASSHSSTTSWMRLKFLCLRALRARSSSLRSLLRGWCRRACERGQRRSQGAAAAGAAAGGSGGRPHASPTRRAAALTGSSSRAQAAWQPACRRACLQACRPWRQTRGGRRHPPPFAFWQASRPPCRRRGACRPGAWPSFSRVAYAEPGRSQRP